MSNYHALHLVAESLMIEWELMFNVVCIATGHGERAWERTCKVEPSSVGR